MCVCEFTMMLALTASFMLHSGHLARIALRHTWSLSIQYFGYYLSEQILWWWTFLSWDFLSSFNGIDYKKSFSVSRILSSSFWDWIVVVSTSEVFRDVQIFYPPLWTVRTGYHDVCFSYFYNIKNNKRKNQTRINTYIYLGNGSYVL